MQGLRRVLYLSARDCAWVLTALAAATIVPAICGPHELAQSFGGYTVMLLPPCWLLLVLLRSESGTRLPLLLVALGLLPWSRNALIVVPYYLPHAVAESSGTDRVRVFYSNVETANPNRAGVRRLIDEQQPEIVALIETDETWLRDLDLASEYPYSVTVPRPDNFGAALYSKLPILPGSVSGFVPGGPPAIAADIDIGGAEPLTFVVAHFLIPTDRRQFDFDRALTDAIGEHLDSRSGPVLFAGDLNSSPFASLFAGLRRRAGFSVAMHGYGMFRTWNAKVPFFRLTLDHLFHRGPIETLRVERLPAFGSDHFPVVADFAPSLREIQ